MPSLDHGLPWLSTGGWFMIRSSTGSMPSSYASRSIAVSSENDPSDSPGARVNVGVIVLPLIRLCMPR